MINRIENEDFGRRPMSPQEAKEDLARELTTWEHISLANGENDSLSVNRNNQPFARIIYTPEGYLNARLNVPKNTPEHLTSTLDKYTYRTTRDERFLAIPMRTVAEIADVIRILDFKHEQLIKSRVNGS